MNPVRLRRKIIDVRRDFQQFDNVGNLLGHAGGRIRLNLPVDLRLERRFIGHAAFRGKEAVLRVKQLMGG